MARQFRIPDMQGALWNIYVKLSEIYHEHGGGIVFPFQLNKSWKAFWIWRMKVWGDNDHKVLPDAFDTGCREYQAQKWPLPKWPSLWTSRGKDDYPVHNLLKYHGAEQQQEWCDD